MVSRINSFLLIIILSPIWLVVSILVFIYDGRPIFFKQKRVGKNNRIFFLYKFRTMKNNTPNISTNKLTNPTSYLTTFGNFLRTTSIDELPQLYNILIGDLLFIGPRPALYNQYELISERSKLGISELTPGITGWAQINGRDFIDLDTKIKLDYYYFLNKSLLLDLKIIFWTIIKIIKMDNIK